MAARYASELGMFGGVIADERGRHDQFRSMLSQNLEYLRCFFPQIEQFLSHDVCMQLVEVKFRRITSHHADALHAIKRQECYALRREDAVALPVTTRWEFRVQRKENGDMLTFVQTPKSIVVTLHKKCGDPYSVSVNPCDGADALFLGPIAPTLIPSRLATRRPFDAISSDLSSRIVECIAELLQDHYRLHVLCTSAAVSPRPVVLENATLYQIRNDDDGYKWKTHIAASFHASSIQCACPTHGRESRAGHVRFLFSFCGCKVEKGKCPVHHARDNNGKAICMTNMSCYLSCVHNDKSRGVRMSLPLHECSTVPLLHAIATASILIAEMEADTQDVYDGCDDVCKVVEESFEDKVTPPTTSLANDKLALHALHSGSVGRDARGRLVSRVGVTERWLSELSTAYGHLFPLC